VLGDLPVLRADSNQMALVFQNLITNAIKFRGKDPPEIIISAEQRCSDRWLFSVKDNGIGIPDEAKEGIFDLFTRLERRDDQEGDGIGLATCKKIVESHGGGIWVESEVGKGSTFCFTLPCNGSS
jgi:signal transduction histidine kinase